MYRLCKEKRSLRETSTGVGHAHARALPFHTHSTKNTVLPPLLQQKAWGSGALHYSPTSTTEHDHKTNGLHSRVVYSKAPPHWRTHYLNELAQKLQACESLRVVSAPISETHDCYKGQSASHEAPMGYYKTLQALYGQLNTAHSALALLPKEPLFSTTQSDYRHFCRSELSPSSALDAPPIQGTMTKSGALIRLPTRKAPPSVAAQPQLPRPSVPLPHGSKSSQYMDSFAVPNPPPIFSTPAPDWGKDAGGKSLLQHILEVPKMYVTENQNYGHRNTVLL